MLSQRYLSPEGEALATRTGQFSNHPGSQLSLGLAHANIYPIWDLLDLVKELILWNATQRISMTGVALGGIFERSFSEDPVMGVYQKPEALNQTNDSLP
ncbi:hypothetical protein STEG23_021860 [Scotinomys teguina]